MTVFTRPESLKDAPTHYCSGCGHGIAHRIVSSVIDDLEMRERTICVAPVGCAVMAYDYFDFDVSEAAHGRTPAVAIGIKNVHPDHLVFSYQGDGDLAAIGTAETVHAANRGNNISIVFVNNSVYGMTCGQMAPTTVLGQRTSTTVRGREAATHGHPLRVCELLSSLAGVAYLERVALTTPARVRAAHRAVERAFRCQLEGKGFALVEMLSPCPTYMRMSPTDCVRYIEDEMTKTFPLGIFAGGESDADD